MIGVRKNHQDVNRLVTMSLTSLKWTLRAAKPMAECPPRSGSFEKHNHRRQVEVRSSHPTWYPMMPTDKQSSRQNRQGQKRKCTRLDDDRSPPAIFQLERPPCESDPELAVRRYWVPSSRDPVEAQTHGNSPVIRNRA